MAGRSARVVRLILGMIAIVMGGCAYNVGQRLTEDKVWAAHATALGRVKVIVVGEPLVQDEKHRAKIDSAIREVVGHQPGATVMSDAGPVMRATAPGDEAALAEAKAEGAESVCVLTVGAYGGRLSIGIPVLLEMENEVLYSLRVLDVGTGKVLMESVHYRRVGGAYEICDPSDMQGNLRTMLAGDFRQ